MPIFSKKGGKTHRKIGEIYIRLMWLVIFSGVILTISKFHEGEIEAGIFLGFLVFLAARPVWYGIAILKSKNTLSTRLKNYHIALKLMLFFYGIFMLIYTFKFQDLALAPLFIAFGVLGLFAGLDAWRDFKNTSTDSNWLKEHFEGMLVSGVAAYTGFLAIGGYEFINKYMVGNWVLIPWLLPSVVGMSLILFYKKRFKKV